MRKQLPQFRILLATAFLCFVQISWAEPPGNFDELLKLFNYDPAAPLELKESKVEERAGSKVHDLSYASPKGGRVPAYLVVPPGKGPLAGLVFMHGGNGNRSSLLPGALIMAQAGAVCLLIDSPLNGGRAVTGQTLADFTQPERTRAAMIQNVVDLRRGVDLLAARPDVEAKRLGYVGASYGGTIGGVLAGVEKRIKAYALLVGTGDLGEWLETSQHPTAKRDRGAMTHQQVEDAIRIMSDVQPIRYVGHAAPSALLFQNGRSDPFMPIPAVERYQAAGSEPKQIRWYDAGHGLNADAFRDRANWFSEQIGLGALPAALWQKLKTENTK
jgi:dienelactone hydrolase